jgi:methylmalonyl-CoA mutase
MSDAVAAEVSEGRRAWEEAALASLGGSTLEQLATQTADGIRLAPLYTRDDVATDADEPGWPGIVPFTRGRRPTATAGAGWDIRQRHDESDTELANGRILADLQGGATSIELDTEPMGLTDLAALSRLLDGVMLDVATVALRPHNSGAAELLADLVATDDRLSTVAAELGLDPLGTGGDPAPAVEMALRLRGEMPEARCLAVDGTRLDDAGTSVADQIAGVLASGIDYLRLLTAAGFDLGPACGQLVLHVAAGPDQFETMAALRALRRCWARVTEAAGDAGAAARCRVQVTTSRAVMSQRDPWVNLLRTTTACFAAAVGGADGITVLRYDDAIGPAGTAAAADPALRLARNTQLILTEETGLHRVVDPAGGSWYVEHLTTALASRAWARLGEIERAGGYTAAVRSGLLDTWADEAWSRTAADVARRRRPLTGVSEFAVVTEPPLERREPVTASTRPVRRLAEGFETLRDAADAATAVTGRLPSVFLARLGPPAVHTARATFAANLFAAGGLAVTDGGGFDDPAALAEAYAQQPSALACLCSSDRLYAEWGREAAAALAGAGATEVWLAGSAEVAGIDHHIRAGGDALDDLGRAHRVLGLRTMGVPA